MITFTKVRLPFGWLGNMAPYPVKFGESTYRTSEALFQMLRFLAHPDVQKLIWECTSPMGAKMVAKKHRHLLPDGYEQHDADNMRMCLRLKVEQHPELKAMLLATGEEEIIEDVSARPHGTGLRWGKARRDDGTWHGENLLGRLWMELRETLK